MNFQRSQSKVWFGSQQNSIYDNFHSLPTYYNEKKSLQSITEQHEESLSPENKTNELKRSMMIWGNRKSPSSHSHKSQDSGFSDVETSPTLGTNKKNISTTSDADANERSPSASSRAATPPTVIRRPSKIPIYEEIASVKRLSFSAPSSPNELEESNFEMISPSKSNDSSRSSCRSCKLKRSRVITKNSRLPSLKSLNGSSNDSFTSMPYNNETVYFGDPDMMEEKSLLNSSIDFPAGTSTPKMKSRSLMLENLSKLLPPNRIYKNHLLNGNFASVQSWIDGLQFGVSNEVMSTLQSKSIEMENAILTPTLAYKMIKNLQTKVYLLEKEFEDVENLGNDSILLPSIQGLTDVILDFVVQQEPKKIYYKQCPKYYKKISENLYSIREMVTDLKRLAGKIDLDDLEDFPLNDDLQLIKRYFLITVQVMFKLLISVIADNIEHAKSDIVLRSNITHIANLLWNEFNNIDGFSSLHDAMISNSVVRVLLLVCMENQSSWTKSLSLRALSLLCSTEETIQQFEINSGFEILRDIIVDQQENAKQETKEAISCLAHITGPWQRSSESNFKELKDYVEDYIEGVTKIVETTESSQTMLICIAVLNNLSRLEPTAVYSLISHQSIYKVSRAYERQTKSEYTIFLLQQITSLIFNMSVNRKSHYHLTNKHVLNFILNIFLSIYKDQFEGNAHKAQQNVLKNIFKIMRQLEATSSNHDVEMIWMKIQSKMPSQNSLNNTSFNISNAKNNVTKISIFSQETFF